MGSPKALLDFRGETFLDRLMRCLFTHCSPVIVVLGHQPEVVRAGVRSPGNAIFVLNPNYELGQFSSLQCGLRAVPQWAAGVVFTPVDHPNFEPATIARLTESQAPIAIPQYIGRHGHPVLVSRYLIPEFLALASTDQARTVLTDSAPANGTFEAMEHFIRQKEDGTFVAGDDFYLRFKIHITVNANGTPTVSFSDFAIDCR